VAGTAAFLLVDTPVRWTYYLLAEGPLPTAVLLGVPLPAVAAATAVAWTVPAPAAVAVVDGDSLRGATVRAVWTVTRRPRSVLAAAGVHLAFAAALGVVAAVGLAWVTGTRSPRVALVCAGTLAALAGTFGLALLAALHLGRSTPAPAGGASLPLARLAAATLLVSALVAGAGAVRSAELRPVETTAAPLPEDVDGRYATARENTREASHAYRVAITDGDGEPFVVEHRIDRDDRQYRQLLSGGAVGQDIFAGTGTGSPPLARGGVFDLGTRTVGTDGRQVRAVPDYVRWADRYDWTGALTPPAAVEGWRVADRREGAVVLVVSEPELVFAAMQGRESHRLASVNASRLRAVVDTDRGTLRSVETRFDATLVTADGDRYRVTAEVSYEFTVGVDVERPPALGGLSPGERLWKLFVY
jgi:hypothetical protein